MAGAHWRRIDAAAFINIPGGARTEPIEVPKFDRLVASLNANIPDSAKVDLQARCLTADGWTPWYMMLQVDGGHYKSAKVPPNPYVMFDVDTLIIRSGDKASAFQLQIMTGETPFEKIGLRSAGAAHYLQLSGREVFQKGVANDKPSAAWGKTLDVAPRSQSSEDAKIAARICSPTSTAMALEYFNIHKTTAEFAQAVHDSVSDLYGNWAANASAAGALAGEAFVARLDSFAEIENEIIQNRPVVLSHSWRQNELTNAPIAKSPGHLILVVGFTKEGDLVVNDPAARPGSGRRVYARSEILRTWQLNAPGVVYLFRPRSR